MSRMTILVMAFSISPIRGSEYSVGWNYVREMSRYHDLVVLYGLAGDFMGDLEEIEDSEICKTMKGVEFVPVRPSRFANLLNAPNRAGIVPYSFYLAYRIWHWQAYRKAQQIMAERQIDIVHYLCPIGYREPGYLWKLDKPYIWGPIGGVKNRPARIIAQRSVAAGIKTVLRNAVNSFQFRYSARLPKALQRSDVLLTVSSEMEDLLRRVHNVSSIVLPRTPLTMTPSNGSAW